MKRMFIISMIVAFACVTNLFAERIENEDFIFNGDIIFNGSLSGPDFTTIRGDLAQVIINNHNETNRATNVEASLQLQIITETNRAYRVETNLQAQIRTETNRSYTVDTNLQAQIVIVSNMLDSVTGGQPLNLTNGLTSLNMTNVFHGPTIIRKVVISNCVANYIMTTNNYGYTYTMNVNTPAPNNINYITLPPGHSNDVGGKITIIKLGTNALVIARAPLNGIYYDALLDGTNILNTSQETWASIDLILVKSNKWVATSLVGTWRTVGIP